VNVVDLCAKIDADESTRAKTGQHLLRVDRLVGTISSSNGATNPRADSEADTEGNTQDNKEDNSRDDALALLAQRGPWSATGAVALCQLLLHLQVISAGPSWIDTRLGLVIEEVRLALACLGLFLG